MPAAQGKVSVETKKEMRLFQKGSLSEHTFPTTVIDKDALFSKGNCLSIFWMLKRHYPDFQITHTKKKLNSADSEQDKYLDINTAL